LDIRPVEVPQFGSAPATVVGDSGPVLGWKHRRITLVVTAGLEASSALRVGYSVFGYSLGKLPDVPLRCTAGAFVLRCSDPHPRRQLLPEPSDGLQLPA
jgi:hypothetical protein